MQAALMNIFYIKKIASQHAIWYGFKSMYVMHL